MEMTTEFFRLSVTVACFAALPPNSLQRDRTGQTGRRKSTKYIELRGLGKRELWDGHFSDLTAGNTAKQMNEINLLEGN